MSDDNTTPAKNEQDNKQDNGKTILVETRIKTTSPSWFRELTKAYRERNSVLLVDDGMIGIDPAGDSLLDIGKKAKLSKEQWAGVIVSLGVSASGVGLVVAAILDPEPTSKLGLLIVGGTTCILTGGLSAIRILTNKKPPNVKVGPDGIHLNWD